MGRVGTILQLQWQAYWRRFVRPGDLSTSNEGILFIISILVLFKYFQALKIASLELANGKHAMFEKLLLAIFVVWLFPLSSNSRLKISTKALRQFPLTLKELFAIQVSSLFMPVFAWMIVGSSLALIAPLAKAPNPLAGILAVFLFTVSSFFFGLTLAHLLRSPLWRRLLFLATTVLFLALAVYVVRNNETLQTLRGLSFLPATLVVRVVIGAGTWWSIISLFSTAVVLGCLAFWSLRVSLEVVESSAARGSSSLKFFPGKTGPLSHKDIRYFRKLLEYYVGLFANAVGCLYLLMGDAPGNEVFWIFIIVVFFLNSIMAFNSFGLDYGPGLDRYSLFPLNGTEVLRSKNVAFVTLVALELAPMFLLAFWKLGLMAVMFGVIEVALLGLGYMTCGNILSVNDRFRMEFYRFASGGSPIDELVGVVLSTLPAGIAIKFFGSQLWWVTLPMLMLCFALYVISLRWSGRKIDRLILSGRHAVTAPR
jgi:hypothetical protein